jgi:hypothetical protein
MGSNNFKGFFNGGSGIVQIDPNTWQTFASGGNSTGNEPTAALDAHVASGVPIVVPVISAAQCTGNCGNLQFKIVGWIALKLNPRGTPATTWSGTVVSYASADAYSNGPSVPPTDFPTVWSATLS